MVTRLIYITATFPYSGEMEDFFVPELEELINQGVAVLVVPRSLAGQLVQVSGRLQNKIVAEALFSIRVLFTAFIEFFANPSIVIKIFRTLSEGRQLSLVIKNLLVLPKSFWLAKIARKWGATHIHAQWATTTSTMALFASELSGIPWSFTAHRGDIVQNNLLGTKTRKASFVRFISENGIQLARRVIAGDLDGKIRVIHMGVDLPSQINPKKSAKTTILTPASLLPVKGHKYLIDAVAILRNREVDCHVFLAGEGILYEALQEQVKALSLVDRITFLGQMLHEDLLQFYKKNKVDLVVLPSIDLGNGIHEGIPVSLIEAMSFGIPVISTTTGGIPELLDGDYGLLVPPQEPYSLANAIETLSKDHGLWTKFSKAGRNHILEQFYIKNVVANLIILLEETAIHDSDN